MMERLEVRSRKRRVSNRCSSEPALPLCLRRGEISFHLCHNYLLDLSQPRHQSFLLFDIRSSL